MPFHQKNMKDFVAQWQSSGLQTQGSRVQIPAQPIFFSLHSPFKMLIGNFVKVHFTHKVLVNVKSIYISTKIKPVVIKWQFCHFSVL